MFHLLFERVNKFYEGLFENYGSFLSKYYVYTIAGSFVLNFVLSLGLISSNWIQDVDVLFMPLDSKARVDELTIKRLYSPETMLTHDFYIHQLSDLGLWAEINFQPCRIDPVTKQPDNILKEDYIQEIIKINDYVMKQIKVTEQNKTIGFEDVCARRFGECVVDGLDLLSKDFYETWLKTAVKQKLRSRNEAEAQSLDGDAQEEEQDSNFNQFRFYIKVNGGKSSITDLTIILGKDFRVNEPKENQTTELAYARLLKLRYNLKSTNVADVKLWELKFLDAMKEMMRQTSSDGQIDLQNQCGKRVPSDKWALNNLRVSFGASQSLDLEMVANLDLDSKLIVGTFILIITFSILLMSINSNCVNSPGFMLPMSGILSAVFGMTSAFGLLSLANYRGCNLIMVIPFLVIGIGIDDMFIIYSSFQYTNDKRRLLKIDKNELIKKTLARSGVSITITSLTDFVAFMVGVTTDFKSVQIFCVYAGLSIFFCYFYQLTFFSGFLCLHLKRIEKKLNSFVPCIKQERLNKIPVCAKFTCFSERNALDECDELDSTELADLKATDNPELNSIASAKDTNPAGKSEVKTLRKNSKYRVKAQSATVYSKTRNIAKKCFAFLICTKRGKVATALVYLTYMSLSMYAASQIKEGMELADLVSDESYYGHYIRENFELTDLNPIVMFVIDKPIDYDNPKVRMSLSKFMSNAYKIDGLSKKFRLNWIDYFRDTKIGYKKSLKNMMNTLRAVPPMLNDLIIEKVYFDSNRHVIKREPVNKDNLNKHLEMTGSKNGSSYEYQIVASRFYMQYDSLFFSSRDAVPMNTMRDLCRDSGLPIIPYSITFKYYEQFEQTLPNVIQSFVISLEAMYLIALCFIPDLVSVICILFSMVSIMSGLIGLMHVWGLTLSSITMIELIMSIGFCVDFSAHIVHSFIANSGRGSRSQRALRACMHVGLPILNSAISTVIGVLLLAFCKSYIFISFCKSLLIIMTLGVLNSLFFLPVLLSVIGPHWPRHKELPELSGKAVKPTTSRDVSSNQKNEDVVEEN